MPSSGLGQGIGRGLMAVGSAITNSIVEQKKERMEWAKVDLQKQTLWSEKEFQAATIKLQKDEQELKKLLAGNADKMTMQAAIFNYLGGLEQTAQQHSNVMAQIAATQAGNLKLQTSAQDAAQQVENIRQIGDNARAAAGNKTAVQQTAMTVLGQKRDETTLPGGAVQSQNPPTGVQLQTQMSRFNAPPAGKLATPAPDGQPDANDILELVAQAKAGASDANILATINMNYPNFKQAATWWAEIKAKYVVGQKPAAQGTGPRAATPTRAPASPDSIWARAGRVMQSITTQR